MSTKLTIAKPGFNAKTEKDPNNLVFSSDYNTLKYDTNNVLSLPVVVGANQNYTKRTSVNHNLGYKPFYIVYVKDDTMPNYQPVGRMQAGVGTFRSFVAYVTNTALFVSAYGFSSSGGENYTVNFYYKIFKNNLGL